MCCPCRSDSATMRLPCLAVLLAAVLLHGAAADNKCDPSSTNCAGPVKEGSIQAAAAPAGQKAGSTKYSSGSSAGSGYDDYSSSSTGDSYSSGEYDYEGTYKTRQEGGLEGAKVWGGLYFNAEVVDYGATNYFNEEEGYVPEGYGNSHEGAECAITVYGKEFAYEGHSNSFVVDIDAYGSITLKNVVKKAGKNNAMVIVLKSAAFIGYSIVTELSDNFGGSPGKANLTISGKKITIKVPELTGLTVGQIQEAKWKISVCTAGDCCIGGQFKKHHTVCRAAAGPCDKEEYCTGDNSVCPSDVYKHKGHVCKHPVSFCDAPDVCNGTSIACPELYEPADTPCPWAKDCDSCNTTSTLKYTRTHPMARGYKGGDDYGYGGYGGPSHPNWPNCVGKCTGTGKCVMNPASATCCREDEEAYPFESDEYYGYGDEGSGSGDSYSSGEEGSYSGDEYSSDMKIMRKEDREEAGAVPARVRVAAGWRASTEEEQQQAASTTRARKTRYGKSKRRYGKRKSDKEEKDGEEKKEENKLPWIHGKENDPYKKYKHTKYGGKYGKEEEKPYFKDEKEEEKPSKPVEEKKPVKEEKPADDDKYADKHSTKHKDDDKQHKEEKEPEKEKEEKEPEKQPEKEESKEEEEEEEKYFRYKEQKEKEKTAKKPAPKKEEHREYEKYVEREEDYFGGKKEREAPKSEEEEYFGGKKYLHPGYGPKDEDDEHYGRPGYGRDGPDGPSPYGPGPDGRPGYGDRGREYEGKGPEYGRDGPGYGRDGPEGYGRYDGKYDFYGKEGYGEEEAMPLSCWAAV